MSRPFTDQLKKYIGLLLVFGLAACSGVGTKPVDTAVTEQYQQGLRLMKEKEYQSAVEVFQAITQERSDLVGPYLNMGIAYRKLGQPEASLEAFTQAQKIKPESVVVYNQLGVLHRNEGRFDEAKSAYLKAITVDKSYSPAYRNLGILCDLYLRDFSCAIDNYTQYQTLTQGKDKQVSLWIKDLQRRIGQE